MERISKELIQKSLNPISQQHSVSTVNVFKDTIDKVCPLFKVDSNNKDVVNEIYKYANRKGVYNPDKGIWLWGDVGTGKSTLLKILGEFQRTMDRGFKVINCSTIAADYAAKGLEALNESTYNETFSGVKPVERGFDELGREPLPAKYFGNELNVMQYIFQIRYELRVKTHITTNLKPEGIEMLYGRYIADRAKEMFNFIELKGESRR